MVDHAADPAFY
jgi:hypothetical protein